MLNANGRLNIIYKYINQSYFKQYTFRLNEVLLYLVLEVVHNLRLLSMESVKKYSDIYTFLTLLVHAAMILPVNINRHKIIFNNLSNVFTRPRIQLVN